MNYRKIEKLGIEISSIALGTWGIGAAGWGEIDDNESIETIRYMVERGVNVVDTVIAEGSPDPAAIHTCCRSHQATDNS